MKVLGVIPARYESSRFPGKPLINLKGKSMIQRVYEGVKKSKAFYKVIVATDDQRIVDHVNSFGGEVLMTSSNHQTGTDRCGEVAKKYLEADIVMNIQGDEPLVNVKQLELLINAFEEKEVNIATLACRETNKENLSNQNRIKVVLNHKNDALYFSRSVIPFEKSKTEYNYLRHIGLYAFRRDTLEEIVALKPTPLEKTESLEQLRWIYNGYTIRVKETNIETPNIDVPEDVEKVLSLIN